MRKDVKVGMALSLVIVVLAGWYYTRDDKSDQTVPLGPVAGHELLTEQASSSDVAGEASLEAAVALAEDTPPAEPPDQADVSRGDPLLSAASPVVAQEPPQTLIESVPFEVDVVEDGVRVVDTRSATDDPPAAGGEYVLLEARAPQDVAEEEAVMEVREATGAGRRQLDTPSDAMVWPPARQGGEAAVELYTVQPGDTFATLAEVYYGSQRHAGFLMEANLEIEDPRSLRAGSTIKIPPLPEARSERSSSAPVSRRADANGARTYTVQTGDSFYRIAERVLGAGALWQDIYELNKDMVDDDPKGLRPGMVLVLPPE